MSDTVSNILALAALPEEARATQLAYILDRELAAEIGPVLDLPPASAEKIIRRIVGDKQVKRTDRPQYDLKPEQWLTQSMLEELRGECETEREYAMVAIGYWCGLRATEYTLLQWADLGWSPGDMRRGRTEIIRVTRLKKRFRVGDELRTRMVHDVVLDRGTIRALRNWWSSREGADADSPWIFPGQNGEQACRKTIARHFQRIARRCPSYDPSESRWRRPHALRHSLAVHMAEGGFEMADIQTRLGHSSIESTRVYAQMSTPRKRRTSRAMGISETIVGF